MGAREREVIFQRRGFGRSRKKRVSPLAVGLGFLGALAVGLVAGALYLDRQFSRAEAQELSERQQPGFYGH